MKTCTLCGVDKALDQFYKRAESPDGYRHDCKECVKARVTKRFHREHEKCKANNRQAHAAKVLANPNWYAEHYAANKDRISAHSKKQYAAKRVARIEKQKQWAKANPSKVRTYKSAWKKANPGFVREGTVRRRLACAQQTPVWVDVARIRAYYDVCTFFNAVNGYTKYHVDHIIPLQGTRVSGLHVHSNLQIILASKNLAKGNRFEV